MNSCYDLTVDICVLMDGSNIGDKEYRQESYTLMEMMKTKKKFYLAIDERGKLLSQYLKKLKHGTYGHQWIKEMNGKDKTKIIPWTHIESGIKDELWKARFPIGSEDFNYVVTASGTFCKYLVSRDSHYSARTCRVLKRRLQIKVKAACECHKL